jgi:hypothetical protein
MLTLFSMPSEFPSFERLSGIPLRDAFIASARGASILSAKKNSFGKPYVKSNDSWGEGSDESRQVHGRMRRRGIAGVV